MELSKEALESIMKTCEGCSQIKRVAQKIKEKYPHLNELDIVGDVISSVGDGPIIGSTDEDLMEWTEEVYTKAAT